MLRHFTARDEVRVDYKLTLTRCVLSSDFSKSVMKLRQAVLYWRRWDARTGVTHNVIKLELAVSDPSFT